MSEKCQRATSEAADTSKYRHSYAMYNKCVDEYQKQGYHEVPNTLPPGATSASTPTNQQMTK